MEPAEEDDEDDEDDEDKDEGDGGGEAPGGKLDMARQHSHHPRQVPLPGPPPPLHRTKGGEPRASVFILMR